MRNQPGFVTHFVTQSAYRPELNGETRCLSWIVQESESWHAAEQFR